MPVHKRRISRRTFGVAAAVGASATVAAGATALATTGDTEKARDRRKFELSGAIDVHAHYITPAYRQALIDAGQEHPDGMPGIPDWSAADALTFMDAAHIGSAVLSVSSPGFALGDEARTRQLVRQVNEEGAALVRRYPERFGLFASLPLPDTDAALAETRHAFDALDADGVVLETNYEGTYLVDAVGDALFAELNRRKAVVFLHPASPACWESTALGRPRPVVEFLFDTTRAVMQLIYEGVLGRYPDIRFIVPHAGAALPVLADRIASFATMEDIPPTDVIEALSRLHYDVAGFALPRALPALLNLVSPDRLLYGSDHPFTSAPVATALGVKLAATDTLGHTEKRQMFSGNAAQLFPRLSGTNTD
ncbi:amidohydrolase family protein [Streptomyces sp. NPDC006296]|uniref:amidohydrolase family protein n=1 Tax=Streptomyces sp. NPDC006296 TaxID=3156746 RepID=UPI00339E4AB8